MSTFDAVKIKYSTYNNFIVGLAIILYLLASNLDKIIFMFTLLC
jgi:hypothetical protein